ncbi:MAG TPA: ATP-binding protein [Ktedonobacteraceae bacterium]
MFFSSQEESFPSQQILEESTDSNAAYGILPSGLHWQIIEQSHDCIKLLDLDGHLLYMNQGGQQIMEIDDFSVCRLSEWQSFWSGEALQSVQNALALACRGVGGTFEGEALTAKGTPRWWEVSLSPVFNTEGKVSYILVTSRDVSERRRAQLALADQARLGALNLAVSMALTQHMDLLQMLMGCTQALVKYLDAAFARIWVLDEAQETLELRASSGLYTHLDGGHARVPLGAFKIGRIAQKREPHLTNSVLGDEQVPEQEWARREGMISFAGYPLLVEERLVGVMALFARKPLSAATLDAMASIANAVALGIEHKQLEEERIHLLETAEQARGQAEAALQIRNDFLSSVSHDLKTPLTAIKGIVQIIQRRLQQAARVDASWTLERLKVIESSTTKMHGMVEDILTIAQLKAGQDLNLDRRLLSLFPIVERVLSEQQQTARRHHLRLSTFSEDLPVYGDAIRLDRVVTNLLANAIKYSPEGGSISLDITSEEEDTLLWIAMRIQDEGVGIPAADLPFLFDPFFRASNVRGQIPGTGVGLASVAQVIREHGGTISITSQEGHGSCVLVRLPAIVKQNKPSLEHEAAGKE